MNSKKKTKPQSDKKVGHSSGLYTQHAPKLQKVIRGGRPQYSVAYSKKRRGFFGNIFFKSFLLILTVFTVYNFYSHYQLSDEEIEESSSIWNYLEEIWPFSVVISEIVGWTEADNSEIVGDFAEPEQVVFGDEVSQDLVGDSLAFLSDDEAPEVRAELEKELETKQQELEKQKQDKLSSKIGKEIEKPKDPGVVISSSEGAEDRVLIGNVRSSFASAVTEAGVSYDIVDELVDLFSERVEFSKDFRKGDRFTVIYRSRPDENLKVINTTAKKSGTIRSVIAAELNINGKTIAVLRYVGKDKKVRYYDEKGNLLGQSFLRYPLKFSRISSYFTTARFHPVLKRKRPHHGIDFAAAPGTPIRSIGNGKVVVAGYRGAAGIMVKIQHNERYSTAYLHLSKLAPKLKVGDSVSRGQIIGAVGSTGLCTGPHLHFSMYDKGKYVDPLKIKLPFADSASGDRLNEQYLKRALFTLEHYQKLDLSKIDLG